MRKRVYCLYRVSTKDQVEKDDIPMQKQRCHGFAKEKGCAIVQEGRFRGGCAPYGYQLVKKGRIGKKNKELYDIEIDPTEAVAIKEIFDMTDRFGYGGRKIATELKAKGIINEAALVTQQLQTSAQQYQQKLRKVKADYAKAVTLTRDYGIQVEFNISEEQYLNGMEMS